MLFGIHMCASLFAGHNSPLQISWVRHLNPVLLVSLELLASGHGHGNCEPVYRFRFWLCGCRGDDRCGVASRTRLFQSPVSRPVAGYIDLASKVHQNYTDAQAHRQLCTKSAVSAHSPQDQGLGEEVASAEQVPRPWR